METTISVLAVQHAALGLGCCPRNLPTSGQHAFRGPPPKQEPHFSQIQVLCTVLGVENSSSYACRHDTAVRPSGEGRVMVEVLNPLLASALHSHHPKPSWFPLNRIPRQWNREVLYAWRPYEVQQKTAVHAILPGF